MKKIRQWKRFTERKLGYTDRINRNRISEKEEDEKRDGGRAETTPYYRPRCRANTHSDVGWPEHMVTSPPPPHRPYIYTTPFQTIKKKKNNKIETVKLFNDTHRTSRITRGHCRIGTRKANDRRSTHKAMQSEAGKWPTSRRPERRRSTAAAWTKLRNSGGTRCPLSRATGPVGGAVARAHHLTGPGPSRYASPYRSLRTWPSLP